MSPASLWRWGDPIESLLEAVRDGRVLAIPTESTYGLAVDPRNRVAVERVYALKEREAGKPLPVVVSGIDALSPLGASLADPRLTRLAGRWPAPLTLLLPLEKEVAAAAGTGRLAVRVPAHQRLVSLLASLGGALTATSANRSGEPGMVEPIEVASWLGGTPGAVVIDDGPLPGGQPSTLVGVGERGVEILRPGRIGSEEIDALLGGTGSESFSAGSVEIFADDSH